MTRPVSVGFRKTDNASNFGKRRGEYGFGKSGVLFHARFPSSKLI